MWRSQMGGRTMLDISAMIGKFIRTTDNFSVSSKFASLAIRFCLALRCSLPNFGFPLPFLNRHLRFLVSPNDIRCVQLSIRVLMELAVVLQDKADFCFLLEIILGHLEDQYSSMQENLKCNGLVFHLAVHNRSKLGTISSNTVGAAGF